jgi:hypothetical protein
MNNARISLLVLGLLAPLSTQAQVSMQSVEQTKAAAPAQPRIFYGGTIGLGFGDVQYFELSPLIGVNLTPQLGVGLQLTYRHRKDTRYQQDLTTDDYGATLFGRYRLPGPFYLQAEYEYLDYEYRTSFTTNTTDRSNFSSFMAGGGVSQAVGGNASIYATLLYNFSYDQEDSPYSNPWILRFGVGVGF